MNVLSLFNGISCGRVALERAGIKVERYVSYEIDKYANAVAKKNYPDDEYYGDVTTADFTQYKGFDLVIGGSPCTYWSIAKQGRETTPDGIGGQLFMHFVRAIRETECKWFLYENNFSIHKDIKTFISERLGVEPIMINSALVSAQRRKRCYWTNIPNVILPEDRGIYLRDVIDDGYVDREKSLCMTSRYAGFQGTQSYLCRRYLGKHINQAVFKNKNSMCVVKELFKNNPYFDSDNYFIRNMTPIECERLQTLPDNYTEGVSNTQRYKCIGNGWTVDVIAHILSFIKEMNKNVNL